MEAETWQSALATVGAFAFLGAFIDFLLGSVGQGDLKKLLATWWLRLSYVRLENFGREEATVALQVLDGLFGSRLFSIKRLRSTAVVTAVLLMIYFVIPLLFSPARVKVHSILDWINLGRLSIAASLFAVSISITRFFTNIALRAFFPKHPEKYFPPDNILAYSVYPFLFLARFNDIHPRHGCHNVERLA